MIDASSEADIPTIREGYLWEPIPEGCLLFQEKTGKLITLNSSAEAVLTHCDGELTVGEICRVLENEFQIPAAETGSVLKRLREEQVIDFSPSR
jgi:hypothetical protein